MRFPFISRQSAFCLFFAAALCAFAPDVLAEEKTPLAPDKDLCAKMFRFGLQSYERGRYLDAKAYFRMAIQADPDAATAWTYYDRATVFALAEKVEKDASLIAPDVSPGTREGPDKADSPVSPPPQTGPAKKNTFVIVEDEGC